MLIPTILDLASLVTGFIGTIVLAWAVGTPPESGVWASQKIRGKKYPVAFVIPYRWRWGIGLISVAFALQLIKVVISLRN